ncbi:sodium-dependent transporter [Halocatena salina]|uniref:Sodium-dependent transporter n=1 Tax=Halocatena salina TaxID=2934340 RepID=A0A8U0A2M0_9EURY|nr:sodium-dependent transporter [Halocatena salina]UPM43451.1 sodium-dependent transporter [Halocatena salina]
MVERETWISRAGFIFAAVGSAVGLGNIWRFPWLTAQNGGSAFLLVYLIIVLGVGVPGLLASFVIGRRSKRNPVGAFKSLGGGRVWTALGGLCVVTSIVLISFYTVVGGWILRYLLESFTGAYFTQPAAHFDSIAFGTQAFFYQVVFLLVTVVVVMAGVRKGIEATTKLMTPAIILLLGGLAVWAFYQPDTASGYEFYLAFDVQYLADNFIAVLGAAAGQALFTLSIGSGTMLTYASYLEEDRSLPADGSIIALLNLGVGVLAGLVVFPLLFSFVGEPTGGGTGALFVSIAGAFATLPGGRLIGGLFFFTILLAALSSSISMLEIPVAYLVDEFDYDRPQATGGLFALVLGAGAINAFDSNVFEIVAGPIVNQLLTLGLIGFMLYTAWILGDEAVEEFTKGGGTIARTVGVPWRYTVGTILPLFLLFSFYTNVISLLGISLPPVAVVGLTVLTGLPVTGSLFQAGRPNND